VERFDLMRINYYLIILCCFFITSCDDDGTIFTGQTEEEEEYNNNLSGDGCSPSTLCYPLEDLYYEFSSSNAISQDYYKYNLIDIVTASYTDDPENTLSLNSFNSTYFVAVPTSSIFSGELEDDVIIMDDSGNYSFDTQSVVELTQTSLDELELQSDLTLVSSNFNIIDYVIWNADQGRYNFLTTTAKRDTTKYIYSQDFDSLNYQTLVDTVLTEIYGDVILIDSSEDVFREYTKYDSLTNGTPIRSKRRLDYKIKDAYVPTDGLMFRSSTDCNDNYRKDEEEIVIFSGYDIDDIGNDADSFELWCDNQGGIFNVDSATLCSTSCTIGENETTMEDYCWDYYSSDDRATGSCYTVTNQVDQITYFGDPGDDDDMLYPMTFCDRGNNLYNQNDEYFLDLDNDGMWSLIGQNYEPFEDRNCNGIPDEAETDSGCQNLSTDVFLGEQFCDEGNRIWDNVEKCYNSSASDCGYAQLYSKADAPDVLIVTHETGSPIAVESAFPSGDFFDTGTDGCVDELEDGNGGCLCEFFDTDGDDNLDGTMPYDIPLCTNFSLSPGEVNFEDLDGDELITELDVAASIRSPFDYGSCSNGFSGSKQDCCEHFLCDWDNDSSACDWNAESCSDLTTYCSDNIMQSCLDASDCEDGDCAVVKWSENLDPNNDNFSTGSNGQTDGNGSYEVGEITNQYIDLSTNELISYQTYFSNLETFSAYTPYIKQADYIVTKELNYAGNIYGGDVLPIISDSLRIITVIDSSPIIDSKNKVKSSKVIDQINLDDGVELSDYIDDISFFSNLLNEFYIIKTEFTNIDGDPDYDYLLFKDSDEYVVKMIHPYYQFVAGVGGVNPPLDENLMPEDTYWQSVQLVADTLLYSYNNNIIEGQSFYSWSTVESDTANYNIQKEYIIERASATLKNSVKDPNCSNFINEDSCNDEVMYWCYWDNLSSSCLSDDITNVSDCLLATRTVTTTSIGTGLTTHLISKTYLKPGYRIVKQDISVLWESMPWVSSSSIDFSILEYKTPSEELVVSSNNNIFNNNVLDASDFQNQQDFNYFPFRMTHTMGLQRLEIPQNE